MIDEPLERCICTGLAGFVFEDRPAGGRRVAVGCSACGIRTEGFPLDRIEEAIMAWEAGDFADAAPIHYPGRPMVQPARADASQPRHFVPAKLRS